MPEHLLNLRLEAGTLSESHDSIQGKPNNMDDVIKGLTCDYCDMTFKTQAMVIYHQAMFCVGKMTEETEERSDSKEENYKDHNMSLEDSTEDVTSDGTIRNKEKTPQVQNLRAKVWGGTHDDNN